MSGGWVAYQIVVLKKNAKNMFWGPEDWCSFPGPGSESHHHGHLTTYHKFANKQDKTNPFFK